MPNRLAASTSPYLLQHAENPVDWFPWGDEAFSEARRLDRPVFLSVGYSSCHWCHVMAHESFEDAEIGQLLNDNFVCIKVDREELPEVDEAYMTAVQLMTGRGGWPMSVFMTPDRKPFFTGTYWPKDNRGDHPGFRNVATQIAQAWKTKRQAVEDSANQISQALTEALNGEVPEAKGKLDAAALDHAVEVLLSDFDHVNGGFGTAPKFPPHTAIEFLLRYAVSQRSSEELPQAALSAAMITLQHLVQGGIHDHVGGGFHRYSTDEKWLLPHFEKMLYDNALMLGNLAMAVDIAAQVEPKLAEQLVRAAHGTIDWLMREMSSEEGLFFSALDADSEGEEGKFYVWTVQEINDLLQHHAPVFLQSFGFSEEGNFADEATGQRTGANILHLTENLSGQFQQELETLRQARETRVRPGLDDKALVGWNGLTIGALADAGIWPLAQNTVVAVLAAEKKHGRLPHLVAKGVPSGEAYLEDYAYFIEGLIKLAMFLAELEEAGEKPEQAIPPDALLGVAEKLAVEMVAKFYDEENGGFFSTSEQHEQLFGRTKPVFDQPTPSANAVAIRCLIHMGDLKRARQSMTALQGWMERAPQATEALYTTAMMLIAASGLAAPESTIEVPSQVVVAAPVVEKPAAPKVELAVTISNREIKANSDGLAVGVVTLQVPEGMHVNSSTPPARWLVPTKLSFNGVDGKVTYPQAVEDQYKGAVEIGFSVQIPKGESGVEFEIKISYQACTESECQAPAEKVFGVVAYR